MAENHDLERIADLLQDCLDRVDAEARRVQQDPDASFPGDGVCERLEDETVLLHKAVGRLLAAMEARQTEPTDVNRAVSRAVETALRELRHPVVLKIVLAEGLLPVRCAAGPLAAAVERGLDLLARHAGPGGVLDLSTRNRGDAVVVQMNARGDCPPAEEMDTGSSLREFVSSLGASFRMDLALAVELPAVLERS
jgi:hypothetical protein